MYDHSVYQRHEDTVDDVSDTLDDLDNSSHSMVEILPEKQAGTDGKMKHGVPLTPFQEKLFDIVLNAFDKAEVRYPVLKMDTCKDIIDEVSERKKTEPVILHKDYPKDTWKDHLKFWSMWFFEFLHEHIDAIFLTIMSGNILWMQIIVSQMDVFNRNRIHVEIFKWILIVMTFVYITQMLYRKARTGWKRLKDWIEE